MFEYKNKFKSKFHFFLSFTRHALEHNVEKAITIIMKRNSTILFNGPCVDNPEFDLRQT